MALCFAGAIAVLATGFSSGMGLSYGIIFAFLVAFFGIPALFVRASRGNGDTKPLAWDRIPRAGDCDRDRHELRQAKRPLSCSCCRFWSCAGQLRS